MSRLDTQQYLLRRSVRNNNYSRYDSIFTRIPYKFTRFSGWRFIEKIFWMNHNPVRGSALADLFRCILVLLLLNTRTIWKPWIMYISGWWRDWGDAPRDEIKFNEKDHQLWLNYAVRWSKERSIHLKGVSLRKDLHSVIYESPYY